MSRVDVWLRAGDEAYSFGEQALSTSPNLQYGRGRSDGEFHDRLGT